ncbi:MAG: iron-containing alcohol dehydrogenase [Desulfobacterales bacterium]|nr:iron-containing alcohol dehydrogenase [Desulfobacterales bacterium]
MSNFRFHCPVKIVSGEHALDKLPGEFKQLGAKRPLIVTDAGVAKAGLLDLVQETFDASELGICGIYDRVPPDSPISAILEIVALYQQNNCDSLLAIGGGSAIDTAKAVKIKLADPAIDLMNFKAVLRMVKPTCPLIVIPTTAGTGSEVTSAAVISDPEKGIKLSLITPAMPPNTAIIDPRMTATLPPRLTASTGMDALTHAVEACLGTQKNPISDAVAGQAIALIAENLVEAVAHGLNLKARLGMANAATLAGIAFSNSMVTMVHALGHSLGAVCHVPHGDAMAICLPDALEFNIDTVGDSLAELLLPMVGPGIYLQTPPQKRAARFIQAIRDLRAKLNELSGLPISLKDAGVRDDQLQAVADLSPSDGAAYYNRKKFTAAEALSVLRKM